MISIVDRCSPKMMQVCRAILFGDHYRSNVWWAVKRGCDMARCAGEGALSGSEETIEHRMVSFKRLIPHIMKRDRGNLPKIGRLGGWKKPRLDGSTTGSASNRATGASAPGTLPPTRQARCGDHFRWEISAANRSRAGGESRRRCTRSGRKPDWVVLQIHRALLSLRPCPTASPGA